MTMEISPLGITYCIEKSLVLLVFFRIEHIVAGEGKASISSAAWVSAWLTIPGRTECPRTQGLDLVARYPTEKRSP